MPNTTTVTGAAADVFWGYRKVGSLGAWSVAGAPGAWTLTATVLSGEEWFSQRPLLIVTPNGWRWPIVETLQIADGTLTASIRPQEPPHVQHSTA
jgi:hypothetical protein